MYSISWILSQKKVAYRQYLAKKTGFLPGPQTDEGIKYFWDQLLKDFEMPNPEGDQKEKKYFKALKEILLNYSHVNPALIDRPKLDLEKKYPWILKTDVKSLFIPLEIIKSLMKEKIFIDNNFLFSLIYKLGLPHQKDLVSLIGVDEIARLNITFEKHILDMSLSLYSWFTFRQLNILEDEMEQQGLKDVLSLLPIKPMPLWLFLEMNLPKFELDNIKHLLALMKTGNKNFYRALSLTNYRQSIILSFFEAGILIPIFDSNYLKKKNIESIKVVAPKEFMHQLSFIYPEFFNNEEK